MKLGEKLKNLRKQKDLTLDKLAELSGVAKATLSRIENGVTTGNLNTHLKICETLGVNLGELYKGLEHAEDKVVSFDEKTIKEAEVFSYDEKVSSIILAKQTGKKKMLPQLLIIEPGRGTTIEESQPGTDKFIYCLEGEVELKIAGNAYAVKKNGSSYFDASLPHSIKNIGQKSAKLIVVVSPVTL
ncbi:MAG: XRE family transcriptional regulator [Candidatus Omnitrophota bacterium]